MQQSLIFKTTCKDGMLQVDQMNIYVIAPFNKPVWSIPRNSVTNIIQKPSFLTTEVEIYSAYGVYIVQTIPKQKANEFVMLFAQPQIQTAPIGKSIDAEIQQTKIAIEQVRLQLSQVNANMSNVRSHYQQNHLPGGGGQIWGIMRSIERSGKDSKLRKQQPIKEQLQKEKLALEQHLGQLKILKVQGVTTITPPRKAK